MVRVSKLLVAILALALPAVAAAQQNWDAVEVTAVEVTDGIYMLMGAGGNIGLSVGSDGAFVIDDQFEPLHDKIVAAVREAGGGDVRFVVNTHWHGDHTGGNGPMGEAGAMIVAHENVRRRMDPGTFTDVVGSTGQAPPVALPVVTFTDSVSFWWNGETIQATHVPSAHTDGDSVVWFRNANVVHMGDNFFNGTLPFIDVDSGGNINGMIAAAEHVLANADDMTKIIPGHGPLSGAAQLREFHEMLVTIRDRIQTHVDNGDSLEDTVAANPIAEFADMASGWMPVERFIGLVYRSLAE